MYTLLGMIFWFFAVCITIGIVVRVLLYLFVAVCAVGMAIRLVFAIIWRVLRFLTLYGWFHLAGGAEVQWSDLFHFFCALPSRH